MGSVKRVLASNAAALGFLLSASAAAVAGNAAVLTDRELDRVTAGGAIVAAVTDAQAAGALALTSTTANSVVVPESSPYPGNPGLGPTGGAADGTATAVGTNLGLRNEPPPSSSTSVQTGGVANGNQLMSSTINQTVTGAGGVTFQAGWTFVYGAWVGL